MDMGGSGGALFGIVAFYVFLSAILPVATLLFAALQKLAVAFPAAANFTLDNFRQALSINAVRTAMWNSLILGAVTATLGVVITGLLALDHPAQPAAGPRRARISRHVSRRPCRASSSRSA